MAGNDVETEGCASSLCSSANEGPVLVLLNKRLRALKKKYNRILQIEENKGQGKPINREQQEVLKSKATVQALIDEYEKLRQPLSVALKEELAEVEKKMTSVSMCSKDAEQERVEEEVVSEANESLLHDDVCVDRKANNVSFVPFEDLENAEAQTDDVDNEIADLVKLLYFSRLFDLTPCQSDVRSILWTKVHERSSCLSYDFVTEDSTSPLLESDLDALSHLGSLITSRPWDAMISHKDALQRCIERAHCWLQKIGTPVEQDRHSYAHLKERLDRILSSEYFTMIPHAINQQVAVAAAAGQQPYFLSPFLAFGGEATDANISSHKVDIQTFTAGGPPSMNGGQVMQQTNFPSQTGEVGNMHEQQPHQLNVKAGAQGFVGSGGC